MSSCCSTNRNSKHTVWFLLVVATLLGCSMLLYMSYHYSEKNQSSCENCVNIENSRSEKLSQANCPKICSSKECVSAANILLENMDTSVDPCDDFYSFSCGDWVKRFSKYDNYSIINDMEKRLKFTLKDLLDNLNGPKGGRSEKLKIVYDSCMNDDSSEFKTVSTIREFLLGIGIEGWPDLAPNFQFAESSMERTVGKLAAYNEFSLIKFVLTEHEEQDEHSQISNLTADAEYALMYDDSQTELYEDIILKIMRYFGINSEKSNRTWEDFKKVDSALFKLFLESSAAEREIQDFEETHFYVNCTLENPDKYVDICKALKYFVDFSEIGHCFHAHRALIPNSSFLENILPLMHNFTQREVASYLSLRFIVNHLDVLDIRFRSILLGSEEATSRYPDIKVWAEQWEQCVGWVSHHMAHAVGQEFVSRKISEGQLEEMYSIVRIYIQEARIYISNQKWIAENDKNKLKNVVGNMTNKMEEYVNVLSNVSIFNSLVDDFNPTNQSFLQNVLEYRKNTLSFYLLNYKEMKTEEDSLLSLSYFYVVNAYHFPGAIDVRFGMYMPPVYQYGRPKLLNLASLGISISHEIGHEIVEFFEESENLTAEVRKKFQEKKKCLEEQYFNYEVKKIARKVKGNETSWENLSDLIGIEITQQVIENYSRKSNGVYEDFELPAMNFSSKQLFYISLAQLWCSVRSKEKEQKHYSGDVHSPYDIRITGMMRNLPEFSKEFSCSSNTNMNPNYRCSIRD